MTQWHKRVKDCKHCGHLREEHRQLWDGSIGCMHVDIVQGKEEHKKMCACRILGTDYQQEEDVECEKVLNQESVCLRAKEGEESAHEPMGPRHASGSSPDALNNNEVAK